MIKPLHNTVLVHKLPGEDEEKVSPGGIILPGGDRPAKSNMMKGVILAQGPGTDEKPAIDVSPGDVVVFNKYSADFFGIKGLDVITVQTTDVRVNITNSIEDADPKLVSEIMTKFHAAAGTPQQNDGDSGGA